MKSKIVELFEKVQAIPYRVTKYDEKELGNVLEGDCRHKSEILFRLLRENGFNAKKIIVIFDWRDLPLSKEMLGIIKDSGTIWPHRALKVKINDRWVKVDCTWNLELGKLGFPVTKNWDGESDTSQVTNGKLKFYDYDKYDNKIKIVKGETSKFAEALNQWLGKL